MKPPLSIVMASAILTGMLLFPGCKEERHFDVSGAFEAVTTIISAQATGSIEQFDVEEGQTLDSGQYIGYIDSTQVFLKKRQLQAQSGATLSQQPDIPLRIGALKQQLLHAQHERDRLASLVKSDAATGKQLDDADAEVALIQREITAQQSSLQTTASSIREATTPIALQIAAVNDQLDKCRLINPVHGTVLTKYAEAHELATPGQPLYKIADLDYLDVRAYATGNQLPSLKINERVQVWADDGKGGYRPYQGQIIWISDQAEFTPKSIQTQEERANLVYAIKIHVKNDGFLKIGQYAAVNFQPGKTGTDTAKTVSGN